jgi:hypothetical protein
MNWSFRSLIACTMVGCLAAAPSLYPGQNQAAGVVLDTVRAHVGESNLTNGSSLYSGDVVATESEGHVQLRVHQTRFELIGQSDGAFFAGANGAVAELRHGTMVVGLNSPAEGFEVIASDIRIVSKNDRPVLAEITLNSTCDVQIKVVHGNLEATTGKETKRLEEGHAYDVTPEFSVNDSRNPAISPDASEYHRGHQHSTCALAAKSGPRPAHAGSSHFVELVSTVTGVITILALHEALESPDRP